MAGLMGVPEKCKGDILFLGSIVKIMQGRFYVMAVAVADISPYRAERNQVPKRGAGSEITVSADPVKRDIGEGLLQSERVPLMITQMDDHIRLTTANSGDHRLDQPMTVRKNGSDHAKISFENTDDLSVVNKTDAPE